jgi:hypothetical protein
VLLEFKIVSENDEMKGTAKFILSLLVFTDSLIKSVIGFLNIAIVVIVV